MSHHPSRLRIGSTLAAALLLVSLLPQAAAAQALEPMVAGLGCIGHSYELADTGMCTHGTDPVPDFIRERGSPRRVSTLTMSPQSTTAVGCDGDGSSGKRVQALYAYVSGRTNRRSAWIASFRAWASNVDSMFKASAAETGGSRRLRWVTNNCALNVPAVAVTSAAEKNFGTLISELSALGYNRPDRKYLIWIDSDRTQTSSCGVATVWGDDRPTGNVNNERTAYARIDYVCWDFAEQHELMHTLGAVQSSAPNASAGLHCTDEYDQMCYDDNGAAEPSVRYVCPFRYEALFDCNHDDYFSTAPAPGSYLATHWNTANSGWLINAPAAPTAPANDMLAAAAALTGASGSVSGTTLAATQESGEAGATGASAPIDSVWYTLTAPQDGLLLVDTCGSALDTTLGAWAGGAIGSLTLLAGNDDDPTGSCGADSRLEISASAGQALALSVDGRGTAEGPFTLNWRFAPAGADLIAPVVQPARGTLNGPQTLSSTVTALVAWPETADDSGIAAYELQRRRGSGAWLTVTLPDPTATSATVALSTGFAHSFRVRAVDGAGNIGPWATTTTGKIAVLQETANQVTYSGRFPRAALNGASGGYVRRTGTAGRTATLSFTGRAVGFVTTLGSDRGIAQVSLDGGAWQTVDLYAASLGTRRVIWVAAPDYGPHTLQVRVTGTRNAAATGSRVDIDAFINWR